MKLNVVLITLLCLCTYNTVKAQDTPLPEYAEVVMFLKSDNTLVALDKSDIVTESIALLFPIHMKIPVR